MNQNHGRSSPGPMKKPTCLCGLNGLYNSKYDSYYCPESNVWLEKDCGCSEDICPFPKRPILNPSEADCFIEVYEINDVLNEKD